MSPKRSIRPARTPYRSEESLHAVSPDAGEGGRSGQDWRSMLDAMVGGSHREPALLLVASFGAAPTAHASGVGANSLAARLVARLAEAFPGALVAAMEEDRFLVAGPASETDLSTLPVIAETLSRPLDLGGRRILLKASLGCVVTDIAVPSPAECLARCECARAAAARVGGPTIVFYGEAARGNTAGAQANHPPGAADRGGSGGTSHADRR